MLFVGSRTGRSLPHRDPPGTQFFGVLGGPRERKVRTPQSSVPDNVREAWFKPGRRKVPQKTYRRGGNAGVRVKRCGKSAPPPQQCGGQGKPHTEQDQIGRKLQLRLECVLARRAKPPGRSLELRSNARPRGMTVLPELSGRQNSAYRSGCHLFCHAGPSLRSGSRQQAPASLPPAQRLGLQVRLPSAATRGPVNPILILLSSIPDTSHPESAAN